MSIPSLAAINDSSFWNIEPNHRYRTGDGFGNPERWMTEIPDYLIPVHSIIFLLGTLHALVKAGYHGSSMLYHKSKSFDQTKGGAIDQPLKNLLLEEKEATLKKITNLGYTEGDLPQLEHALQLTRHQEAFHNTWILVKFFAFAIIPYFGLTCNIFWDEAHILHHAPFRIQFVNSDNKVLYASQHDALEALIRHLQNGSPSESDSPF